MKNLDIGGLMNHVCATSNMVRQEWEQERKHANNARCKPANWGGVASYIEYAFGIECTAEEVDKAAHSYNFH